MKNSHGLGRAMLNDRAKQRANRGQSELHTTDVNESPNWVKLQSVTQERDLDEFLNTAQLSGTDFTAERQNIMVINNDSHVNPYLPSHEEYLETLEKQKHEQHRLVIPRRPEWDSNTSALELDRREKDSFLSWRRSLAELQDNGDLLLTPFERNIEVWRQLWRVVERSEVVVQIVDARNPLLYRCNDLETYVKEISPTKRNILLINKADLLTEDQRSTWAGYFRDRNVDFTFFSAALAGEGDSETAPKGGQSPLDDAATKVAQSAIDSADMAKVATKILTVGELEALLFEILSEKTDETHSTRTVGLVGYPNVGKSSTINALIDAKKVSVSSTPGKTKHFQTIHLTPELILCDCPGLVFPNFATTKAELVCNGILPIDQLKDHMAPGSLLAERIPQSLLELKYGIKIPIRPVAEGGSGIPTAEELLTAYASARGYTKSGQGNPDESRAARVLLKDYINGRLLFCHPPPDLVSDAEFNREANEIRLRELRQRKSLAEPEPEDQLAESRTPSTSATAKEMDTEFFDTESTARPMIRGHKLAAPEGVGYSRTTLYPHQNMVNNDGSPAVPNGESVQIKSKKHFKGKKRS